MIRAIAAVLACALAVAASPATAVQKPIVVKAEVVTWMPAPASLPTGAQVSVLEGDPGKPGSLALRLKVPDGYRIPPHWHPRVERVTVLQGTFRLGQGEKWDDAKLQDLPAGSYFVFPSRHRHFAEARGETILQLNVEGPWRIVYVNPADDPREKAK